MHLARIAPKKVSFRPQAATYIRTSYKNNVATKMFILVYNNGYYELDNTTIHGVFSSYDEALLGGWKFLLERALRPHKLQFYKTKYDKECRGMGTYYLDEWNVATNKRVNVFMLGERIENHSWDYALDKYLKQHHADCESILRGWYDEVCAGRVPSMLRGMTYV